MSTLKHVLLWQTYVEIVIKACNAADLESALIVMEYALADAEELLEIDDRLARATHDLSLRLCEARKLNGAEAINRRLLEVREKVLGVDHPDVADSLRRLASLSAMKAGSELARVAG